MQVSNPIAIALVASLLFLPGCNRNSGVEAESAPRYLAPDFVRGMTFAHEGYRGHNGYGGTTSGPALDSLLHLNVNAVAIVPYTFVRDTTRVDELPVPTREGSETDAAVRACIRSAHDRGLTVMLKPQIWVRGAWPGSIGFDSAAGWDAFFDAYESWILHYGKMAEEEGVAALCIGTELVKTTLAHPERWRSIIASLRGVYSGQLTYAANWGPEFENLTFWKDLDVMGLNSYYPLSQSDNPTDEQLEQGARSWMRMADSISLAHDRPLWLTEVGYRSVKNAWVNPHAEAGGRGESPEDQARCYTALATAVHSSTRLNGMFVWKWPSYLGHVEGRDEGQTGFVPGGKPAGDVLTRLYAPPPPTFDTIRVR